ncbi:MAG: hypothetical protein LBT50_03960 [Prevotellaceae bacterium]|jgi:ribulose-5-phosphate 4-epimerase/fuculose-1-phosphate aldolase|nr:hypothetical protein [Prevotellaceae bacterium]
MLAFKEKIYNATLELVEYHLVSHSWSNVSAIGRKPEVLAIKPHKTNIIKDFRFGDR